MDDHLHTGLVGEEVACRYLEEKGYRILERNWRFVHKEIDIIAQRGGTLVIVEVKTRGAGSYVPSRQTLDTAKKHHLIRAANAYVRYQGLEVDVRYDLLAIDILPDRTYRLEHIEGAFVPTLQTRNTPHMQRRGRRIR